MGLLTRKRKSEGTQAGGSKNSRNYDDSSSREETRSRESIENDVEGRTDDEYEDSNVFTQKSAMSNSNKVNVLLSKRARESEQQSPSEIEDRTFLQKMSGKRECPYGSREESKRKRTNRVIMDEDNQDDVEEPSIINSSEVLEESLVLEELTNIAEEEVEEPNTFGVPFDVEMTASQMLGSRSQFTRRLQQQHEQDGNKKQLLEGEPGHILSIALLNFMCHENFSLELGPRINFVVGPNGSGKSAILSGIVLGFGGRASNTNRGSLNSFIKTGQASAKITIKLCNYINEGNKCDAYLPDKYGKSITIERTIRSSGTSGYKIKSDSGKVVSEKKEEVDNITKHFQILVDNPICVLTQEVSKNFLNSKNPKDKYKFFTKATQLEDVKNDYENAHLNKDNSLKLMNEKDESIKHLEKQLKDQEKKVKIIEVVKNSVNQLETLHNEGLWANLKEKAVEIDKMTKEHDEISNKCERYDKKIEVANQEIEKLTEKKQVLLDRVQNLRSEIENAKQDFEKASDDSEGVKRQLTAKARDYNVVKSEITGLLKEISDLEKRIYGIESQNEGVRSINFESELENLKDQIESKRQEENNLQMNFRSLVEAKEEIVREKQRFLDEERKHKALINSHNAEIERLNRSQKNRLSRYGPKYADVMTQVENAFKAGKFQQRPYGPVCEYIDLQDQSAGLAVECCLRRNILSFIVDNGNDARTLRAIFDKIFRSYEAPDIITRKYRPLLDVSRHETRSPKHLNFLQLLNIKEPEVANALIDHFKIEKILYIPNYKEAQNLLIRPDTSPRNCMVAYTVNGDVMYPSTDRTDYKCYPNKKSQMVRYLVQDCKTAISDHRKVIAESNHAISGNVDQIRELTRQIDANKKELDTIEHTINGIKMDVMKLEKQYKDLKIKSQIKPVEVLTLKEELHKFKSERDECQVRMEALRTERDAVNVRYKELIDEKDSKYALYQKTIYSRQPINDEIAGLESEINNKARGRANQIQLKEETTDKLSQLESKLNSEKSEYETRREYALGITNEEIQTRKKYNDILTQIKRIQLIIEQNQSMTDERNQNEIIEKYKQLDQMFSRLSSEMDQLIQYINLLSNSLEDRKVAYYNLRFYITRVCSFFFELILKNKGFSGSINVNFYDQTDEEGKLKKAKTLDIVIYPRDKKQFESSDGMESQDDVNSMYSSTKSLSGGERSYSTVAFIISLWQICPSPFRLLDEVDVFMDMVTRKISIDTLVKFATDSSSKQFIFLSPLRIQKIEDPKCVKIFQMPEIIRD